MSSVQFLTRAGASVALAVVTLAGCAASDSTSANARRSLSLSFTSQSSASADVAASAIPVTSGGHTLDITSTTLNIARVELHSTQRGEMENSECDDGHGCSPVATTPLTVNLTSTAALVTVTTSLVPAGTYREIGVKVASVRLAGTYDGRAFDVVVPVNVEREMEFNPPVTIGDSTDANRNITVAITPAAWLMNSDGSLIDPSLLATNATLQATVASRIRASLRAFRDDNHNSRDDDNDEHTGGNR